MGPMGEAASEQAGAVEVISQTSMPLEVGQVHLNAQGILEQRDPSQPIAFSFTYNGVKFAAEVPVDDAGTLRLTAILGVIPYSIENAFGRRAALAIIHRARLPSGHLRVDRNSRVHLSLEGIPDRPRTPVSVLSTVATLLMEAKPYLELLEVPLQHKPRRGNRRLA